MKKLATLTVLSLLAMLIVLPTACSVNYSPSTSLTADGSPTPFPVPHVQDNSFLTADGSPTPFPVPWQNSLAV